MYARVNECAREGMTSVSMFVCGFWFVVELISTVSNAEFQAITYNIRNEEYQIEHQEKPD